MQEVVLDASAALEWLFLDKPAVPLASDPVSNASFVAPWLWRLEVVNAVLVKERQKVLTHTEAARCLRYLQALNVHLVDEPLGRGLERLAAFARPHQLTAYDAVYVELALTKGLPLLTFDRNQQAAARRLGIEVIG
jgi:predicted nucleic acid-binding protein